MYLSTAIEYGSPYVNEESISDSADKVFELLKGYQQRNEEEFPYRLREFGLNTLDRDHILARTREEYAATYYLCADDFFGSAIKIVKTVMKEFDPAKTVLFTPAPISSGYFLPSLLPDFRRVSLFMGDFQYHDSSNNSWVSVRNETILHLDEWALTGSQMLEQHARLADYSDDIKFFYMVMSDQAKDLARKYGLHVNTDWEVPSPIKSTSDIHIANFTYHNIYGVHKISDTLHKLLADRDGERGPKYSVFKGVNGELLPKGERLLDLRKIAASFLAAR
jgi:hypothetical protein